MGGQKQKIALSQQSFFLFSPDPAGKGDLIAKPPFGGIVHESLPFSVSCHDEPGFRHLRNDFCKQIHTVVSAFFFGKSAQKEKPVTAGLVFLKRNRGAVVPDHRHLFLRNHTGKGLFPVIRQNNKEIAGTPGLFDERLFERRGMDVEGVKVGGVDVIDDADPLFPG